ncbi:MOSC domain-containing protein [Intestinibacter sp.]|uniref:MOSC domain-containing protein n=1 Tax=Intestinibacter sp. TaxID=1965304 RepID=UPI002A7545DF|nr:MOSC domain-containing protein [Intestinibacter sp.]MDY2735319.1 MOSC domain-containing protein [Intestinibacter sp.]MDY4573546.1 MOSC domain-containing protein [Intestinibacter sp.]
MGKIIAVCTSEKKGVQKKAVDEITLVPDYGIEGDAHAGKWHRQVSLLSYERVQEFNALGAGVDHGAFGENLIVEGYDLKTIPVGTIFECNGVVLEITQIGKECHSHCAIHKKMGTCIMPTNGIFAKVIKGGTIKAGDEIVIKGEK